MNLTVVQRLKIRKLYKVVHLRSRNMPSKNSFRGIYIIPNAVKIIFLLWSATFAKFVINFFFSSLGQCIITQNPPKKKKKNHPSSLLFSYHNCCDSLHFLLFSLGKYSEYLPMTDDDDTGIDGFLPLSTYPNT